MVSEVFLIKEGTLNFYYNSNEDSEEKENQAILSSGLLDAIRSFTEETREQTLESFVMKDERFIFKKLNANAPNIVLAVVFDNEIPVKHAQLVVEDIASTIEQSTFLNDETLPDLHSNEKKALKLEISRIATQYLSTEFEKDYISDLFKSRQDIPLAYLIDADTKQVIAHFARPKQLFKSKIVSVTNLLYDSLATLMERLNLGRSDDIKFFSIQAGEYAIGSVQCGRKLAVASGANMVPKEIVLHAGMKMCHIRDVFDTHQDIQTVMTKADMDVNGNLTTKQGQSFVPIANIFFSTLITNLNNFSKALTRRTCTYFSLYYQHERMKKLVISKQVETGTYDIILATY